MLLMIDNYDSFTYNLVQYLGELGAETVVHRNDAISLPDIEALRPGGIILSPGPCTPDEAGICMDVVRAFGPRLPVLGICLGHQCIGQAFGGEGGAGRRGDARQNLQSPSPRRRAVRRPAQSFSGDALSFLGGGAEQLAGLLGNDRLDRA